ncbi:hypothetical protein ACTFIZ_002420 [Dictyostelium cf. discoideum]
MEKVEFENGYHVVGINRGLPAKLYYEIYGNKDAKNKIMFLNGLSQATTSLKYQIDFFKKLDDFQICVYDNRGVGKSNSFTYSLKTNALDAIELVKFLNWKKVNFVGISFGGSVCFHIASLIEEELINSVLISGPWLGIIEYPSLIPVTMFYPYFIRDKGKRIQTWNKQLFSNKFLTSPSKQNPEISNGDLLVQMFLKSKSVISYSPKNIFIFASQFVSLFFFHLTKSKKNDISKKSYTKIGVIASKHDQISNFEILKKISTEINAWKLYVADAGHHLTIENPEFLNITIVKHIYNSNLTNDFSQNNIIINSKL